MLERRRVFDLTNTIINYLFMVFLLLAAIYFVSFWFKLKGGFIDMVISWVNVVAWTVTAISVLVVLIALVITVLDHELKLGTLVWSLVRMAVCIALSVVIDVCSVLVAEGVKVSL